MAWIAKNAYLSQSEMENNAQMVYNKTTSLMWTMNATAGILGNMEAESTINPGIWQNLTPNPSMGWGLVQWTPSTNFTNWADENGFARDDGDAQMQWIHLFTDQGQWIETSKYQVSWEEFKFGNLSVEDAAGAFLYNFERPSDVDSKLAGRQASALRWYEFLTGHPPDPPDPPDPKPKTSKLLSYPFRRRKYNR